MSQSAVIERKSAERKPATNSFTEEKPKARLIVAEAPAVERVRNVGGRLMA